MINGVIVREAQEKDLGVLANLMTELGYPTSTEDMARRFEEISGDPSYCALVAEMDGRRSVWSGYHSVRYAIRKLRYAHGRGWKMSSLPQLRVSPA